MNRSRNKSVSSSSRWLGGGMIALMLATGDRVVAQPTNTPARLDYSSFKLITDRNIFNPNRSARLPRTEGRETRSEVRAESFALVGTMSYEKGLFAFFDGASSDYRKVLKTQDAIAGYKVMDIAPNQVKLASGTNEVNLPVGMQMRRKEEGGWTLSARVEADSPHPIQSTATRTISPTTAPAGEPRTVASDTEPAIVVIDGQPENIATNAEPQTASGGSENDVLTRLRQRREQELNR
jgi:hypothetical protein